jgi:4-carboxymuconolactone decarboxylase
VGGARDRLRPALGLTGEQIAATVAGDADDPAWSPTDRLLVRLADELHDTCTVSGPLWSELADHYTDEQLLELVIVAGWYRLLSGVINAVGVPREPWGARFPDRMTGRNPRRPSAQG